MFLKNPSLFLVWPCLQCLLSDYVSPCTTLIGVTGRGNFKDRQIFAPCSYCISSTSHRDFYKFSPPDYYMYILLLHWYSYDIMIFMFPWQPILLITVMWGSQLRISGQNNKNNREEYNKRKRKRLVGLLFEFSFPPQPY